MNNTTDAELDELIAAANPLPEPDRVTPPPRFAAAAVARRRRRILAPLAAATAVALSAAATYALLPSRTHQPLTVSCAAHLSEEVTTGVVADGRSPTEECADVWARGEMIAGRRAVPPLQACIYGNQVIVYPRTDACSTLHRAPFAGYTSHQNAAITVNRRLNAYQNGHRCSPVHTLITVARDQLNRTGLGSWRIANTAGHPRCARADLDPDNQQVILTAEGR